MAWPGEQKGMKTAADYGIPLKPRGRAIKPVTLDLESPEGKVRLMQSAYRVMRRHYLVIASMARK
ncbi:hypothetical protein CH06BL_21910 [Chromobacterium haemolyticum]|nr:hypothetical protein CH06BL_21910 [Chromobacterium haemolyticum]